MLGQLDGKSVNIWETWTKWWTQTGPNFHLQSAQRVGHNLGTKQQQSNTEGQAFQVHMECLLRW